MTVVGDFVFPGEQFVLNETTEVPDLEPDITIEQMVAHVDEGLTPYFRISAQNIQNVERALEADSTIKNIEPLERVDHERFYRAHWTSGVEGLMTVLQDTNGGIKAATFHDGEWEVRLLFADRKNLKACFEQCRKELDSSIELVRVFDRSIESGNVWRIRSYPRATRCLADRA